MCNSFTFIYFRKFIRAVCYCWDAYTESEMVLREVTRFFLGEVGKAFIPDHFPGCYSCDAEIDSEMVLFFKIF